MPDNDKIITPENQGNITPKSGIPLIKQSKQSVLPSIGSMKRVEQIKNPKLSKKEMEEAAAQAALRDKAEEFSNTTSLNDLLQSVRGNNPYYKDTTDSYTLGFNPYTAFDALGDDATFNIDDNFSQRASDQQSGWQQAGYAITGGITSGVMRALRAIASIPNLIPDYEGEGSEGYQNLTLNMTASTAVPNQNSFTAVEPGTVIKALMSTYQLDFTTDNVLTGTASTFTGEFLNKSLFDCMQTICQQFNYVWYVNNDKDVVVRNAATVVSTPVSDYLTYTDNMYEIVEENNKEFLCNDIIVYGTNSTVSNGGAAIQDTDSITSYGVNSKRIVVSSLTNNTDCTNFANAYISVYKDPITQFKTKSRLVAFSDPLQYITVTSDKTGVSGQYQIREITHYYDKSGIKTNMILNQKVTDLSMSLGQLLQRVQTLEVTNYV